jgi:Arc/MetJ-type ribon-helix-helix transcriptional regulator
MKPAKKKNRIFDRSENDEVIRKPVKKLLAKRDRKPTVYDAYNEEDEGEDFDLFRFDDDDTLNEDEDDV